MPRPSRPWFRFYTEALSDRKLRRLTPAQRWLWVAVLGASRQSCVPGLLLVSGTEPMLVADLADLAGMTEKEVAVGIDAFVRSGMVDIDAEWCPEPVWRVVNWKERQYESDVSTDRTRKHRSKERSNGVPETPEGTEAERSAEQDHSQTPLPPAEPLTKPVVEDDGFEAFWQQYPRRDSVRVGKQAAHRAWLRIPTSKRPDVVAALAVYVTRCGEKPKDAERWLKAGVWDEWLTLDIGANEAPAAPTETIRIINGVRHRHSQGAGFIPIVDTPVLVPDLEDYEQ